MKQSFLEPIESPWKNLRGGLVLGDEALWNRVLGLMNGKRGADELHWKRREDRSAALAEGVSKLVEREADHRLKIWLRVRLGQERKVDVARDCGYRDGSAVLQIIKRLERKATMNRVLQRKLSLWKTTNVSSVQS